MDANRPSQTGMPTTRLQSPADGSPELTIIDQICDQFEKAWKTGNQPVLKDFLEKVDVADRPMLLAELVAIDLDYRGRRGEKRRWEDYRAEFPELPARLVREGAVAPGELTQVGRYRLIEQLSGGGQGQTYLAFHPGLKKPVVLKRSLTARQAGSVAADSVLREAQLSAKLRHPHLVEVFDCDVDEGYPFAVMEHIVGATLDVWIKNGNPSRAERFAVLEQIAETVAWLHAQSVAHQDLKPQNVIVTPEGNIKLIDLGLARFFGLWRDRSGECLGGTPGFMAPEIARRLYPHAVASGGPGTAPPAPEPQPNLMLADVYSLGGLMFFLLVGREPYEPRPQEDRNALRGRVVAGQYDLAALEKEKLNASLVRLCRSTLEADPGRRTQSAAEFVKRLEAPSRSRLIALAAAGLLGVALAMVVVGWFIRAPVPASKPAEATPAESSPAVKGPELINLSVSRRGRSSDNLGLALPVHTNEDIRLKAEMPAGVYATFFSINGDGLMMKLVSVEPRDVPFTWTYPKDGKTFKLTGPVGTECFLICGRRLRPVEPEEVQEVWDRARENRWARLPPGGVINFTREGSRFENLDRRDVGPTSATPVPQFQVQNCIDTLRSDLSRHVDFVVGVAFPHDAP
jgi:serine/threonine protein kinase